MSTVYLLFLRFICISSHRNNIFDAWNFWYLPLTCDVILQPNEGWRHCKNWRQSRKRSLSCDQPPGRRLYSAIWFRPIPHHLIPYHAMPLTMLYHLIPSNTIPCHLLPCCTISFYAMPPLTMLFHLILRHATSYHSIPSHTTLYHAIPVI